MRSARNKTTGLGEVVSTRNRSVMCQPYNKAWHTGDKVSVFFPIFWTPEYEYVEDENGNEVEQVVIVQEVDTFGKPVYNEDGTPVMTEKGSWDIIVAQQWGHKCNDMKSTKLPSFIPSLTEVYDKRPVKFQRDENGDVEYDVYGDPIFESIDGDITYQFSKIAPVFIHGRKAAEIKKASNKQWPSPDLLRERLNEIEDEYDTTKNMFAPKPVIGPLTLYASTEVIAVTVDKDDKYMVDSQGLYTYALNSNDKAEVLRNILNDTKFRPRDLNTKFFEVQFTYVGTSDDQKGRAAASRAAAPVGLTPEYQMQNKDPEAFKALKTGLAKLPTDSEIITHRNFSYRKISEGEILRKLEKYAVTHAEDLSGVTEQADIDIMKRNVARLANFKVIDMLDDGEVKNTVKAAYDEWKATHTEQEPALVTQQAGYTEPKMDVPPKVEDMLGMPSEFDDSENFTDLLP